MGTDDDLFASSPARRLAAARSVGRWRRRRLASDDAHWPQTSPGARNAWLLFVTSKPPTWRDSLVPFPEGPLTLGAMHEGFLYPDPMGFWAEVRRWAQLLLRAHEPTWGIADCLAVAALVHVGDEPSHLALAQRTCRPRLTVFLDESAWRTADLDVTVERLAIPDPHRAGQTYEGWWGTTADGAVVGKAPQHPTMHRLYRAEDLDRWLERAPRPR